MSLDSAVSEDAKTEIQEDKEIPRKKTFELDNGQKVTFDTVFIKKKILYHGSATMGIQEFTDAEETTIGSGVYLTSTFDDASRYAVIRSEVGKNPLVYEVELKDLSLVDLTNRSYTEEFAKFFKQELLKWREIFMSSSEKEYLKPFIWNQTIEISDMINRNSFRHLRDLTFSYGDLVRRILKEKEFDGLVGLEGGETGNGISKLQNHDTYVIFDPRRVKILGETQIASRIS